MNKDAFFSGLMGMVVAIFLGSLIFGCCLIHPYLEYKIKIRGIEIVNKCIDRGVRIKLTDEYLNGIQEMGK